jgi:LuxR family maltose regulon positive regulatory protein
MELFVWLEVPSITRARVLVAVGSEQSLAQATELLDELREGSGALRLIGQTIEIAVLQVLALQRQGRAEEALASLKETLALAAPQGWVRPFVEAGPAMVGILRRLDSSAEEAIFVRQILDALERPPVAPSTQEVPSAEKTNARASQTLSRLDRQAVDSLTNREIDVLELLAQRLQNKEIASRLCISPHTVNDHTRRIYDKLGVHGRRQAVKRAVELGLVDRGTPPA